MAASSGFKRDVPDSRERTGSRSKYFATIFQTLAGALAAFTLAAPGAHAQDLTFDIKDTQHCLSTSGTYAEMQSCIGASANACMSATDMGGTTVGMGGCIDRELRYWDDRLNASYRSLRAKDRAEDAEYGSAPGYAKQANALRDMQRAWIAYRDATCDYERAQWGGGTGGGPATLGCLMRLTGRQALYLERMMVEY